MARVSSSTTAALFDLRSVIALLFGVYGVVLTVTGAVGTGQQELDKAGGIDINLWTGIAMLVVAAAFVLWVWLRPPVVPARPEAPDAHPGPGH
jgi:xanthine/uracil/vitamin C permease (AzgA family)